MLKPSLEGFEHNLTSMGDEYNCLMVSTFFGSLILSHSIVFFLDIKLILMTIKIMFIEESTEGFSEEKSKKINEKSREK